MKAFWSRLTNRFKSQDKTPPEIRRARLLITAIDAGGVPLDPARINRIAEDLGLEVSKKARMEDTIARIRRALERY
jgi:hypothetical protein